MDEQKHPEKVGDAKLTSGWNLPAKHVIHTVGPMIRGALREEDIRLLESCYRSVLDRADENGLHSVAFCCISTGVFHFPADVAARTAVETVEKWMEDHPESSVKKVIFNVFSDRDRRLYEELLGS